jgi:diadenosine tetraphosphate (Ap4A) HIT family hydrolase
MIIREVTKQDIPVWLTLAHDKDAIVNELVDDPAGFWVGFADWTERKIQRHEAFIAADRITNKCLGIIAYSHKQNSISFLGVDEDVDYDVIGGKLLGIVLNQLDWDKDITANVLNSNHAIIKKEQSLYAKNGFKEHLRTILEAGVPARKMLKPPIGKQKSGSFHFNYPQYIDWMHEDRCPICNYETKWERHDLIARLEYSTVYSSINAKGGVWGSCIIVSKKHVIELTDFTRDELVNFWSDMQKTAQTLKEVTGAVKINLEQHGNTIPHLHIYLFPRYIDDINGGQPIDYNNNEASVYESKMEYNFFVHQMKKKLSAKPASRNAAEKPEKPHLPGHTAPHQDKTST